MRESKRCSDGEWKDDGTVILQRVQSVTLKSEGTVYLEELLGTRRA